MPPLARVGIGHFSDIQAVRLNGRKRSVADKRGQVQATAKAELQPASAHSRCDHTCSVNAPDHASLSVSGCPLMALSGRFSPPNGCLLSRVNADSLWCRPTCPLMTQSRHFGVSRQRDRRSAQIPRTRAPFTLDRGRFAHEGNSIVAVRSTAYVSALCVWAGTTVRCVSHQWIRSRR